MEAKEEISAPSGFALRSDGVEEPYRMPAPRHQPTTDDSPTRHHDGPTVAPAVPPPPSQQDSHTMASANLTQLQPPPPPPQPQAASLTPASSGTLEVMKKKKRGRPRKYGPDGTVALSPMPISASIPLGGDCSGPWQRSRGRSVESVKKKHKFEFEIPGEKIAYFVGANFTPHVLTVNPGEDVTMKVMSFSQQGSRAICILSANGTISNVTLRQPTSLGGTLTYEGRFEILSLSGSYTPVESGGTVSRSGGMSVSLAGPDGRVLGGGLAGLLVAAGPVQVVLGSFLPGHQLEQKPKKLRVDIPATTPPVITNLNARDETFGHYGGGEPIITPASAFNGETSVQFQNIKSTTETRVPVGVKDSNGLVS